MIVTTLTVIGSSYLTSGIINWVSVLNENKLKLGLLCSFLGFLLIFIISRFDNSHNIAWWTAVLALVLTGLASRNSIPELKRRKRFAQVFFLIAAIVAYIIFYSQTLK